jgi:Rnl2 family RNA ligase
MHLIGYGKIAEATEQWHLDEAQFRQLERVRWVVTEKIHGAHFCLLTDGESIASASRKHLLAPGESFFGYQRLLQRLEAPLQALFRLTRQRYPQMMWLSLYGELFGGAYPHPAVPPVAGVQPVQTGIYYAPDIEFCAFDLAVAENRAAAVYLDYELAHTLCQQAGVLHNPPLLIASYQEALTYNPEFQSTIPALLGLPPLNQDNRAEGVVIRPLKELVLSGPKGTVRPLVKRKIAAFAEDRRFHQAQKWTRPAPASLPDDLEVLKWEAYNHLTINRLRSAISKIGYRGPRETSRSRQLFHLLVADVLEQLELAHPDRLAALSRAEQEALLISLQEEARALLRTFFRQESRRV